MEIYGYPDPTLDLKKHHKLIASIERRHTRTASSVDTIVMATTHLRDK